MKNKPPIASLAVGFTSLGKFKFVCIWDYQLKVLKGRFQTDCALKAEQSGG